MAGDPVIFRPEAQPGMMRNSFTGVRPTFPNNDIHIVIRELIIPCREHLALRPEFQAEVPWHESLVLWAHESLEAISRGIKRYTYRAVTTADSPLDDRRRVLTDYIAAVNDPTTKLEAMLSAGIPSHRDQMLNPPTPSVHTITIDFSGDHPLWPQPVPGRYRDAKARVLIIGLDHLVVELTNCPSADSPSMINPNDAAYLQSLLVEMYALVVRAGTDETPYTPTSIGRDQYDNMKNAAGEWDKPISDGSSQQGDHATLKTAAAAAARRR